jgi:hypothetical protein
MSAPGWWLVRATRGVNAGRRQLDRTTGIPLKAEMVRLSSTDPHQYVRE